MRLVSDMAVAYDPTICLISRHEYKTALMQLIAIAVQRDTADIIIRDSMRTRRLAFGKLTRKREHLATRCRADDSLVRQLPACRRSNSNNSEMKDTTASTQWTATTTVQG